ncbi:hypothetical protein LPJ63_001218 [Coemansia sp. RSA 2711]|nr:hypothetical protein LPJ63_001218 [Coemansia sp. RSA 2711]KAJ2299968.1 hypothetical protein IWW54_006411 [Coemansia sp. RSA 2705]KAJ2306061.1 hypothetical protein IWW52_006300 [Coemansia sp. RSA 2704]KAJ2712263.1 hypothetical protein H4R23_006194 [Coemansia sp. Cherry 401B]
MKSLVFAIAAMSMHISAAQLRPNAASLAEHQAAPSFRQPLMFKQKEDPANPVAAAATDPNEAAMKIKSRDLVPTDRPGARPEIHHRHRPTHGSDDDDDDNDDNDDGNDDGDSDESEAKPSPKSSKSKAAKNRGSDDKDGDDDDAKSKQPTKKGKSDKSKGDKSKNDKESDKKKDKGKDSKDSKDSKAKKGKKTHTGLDGKEVDDEDADDAEAARKKKVQVKHVQAMQRKWRSGRPKYNYRQALAGWKEVGPMYYYTGKYENSAVAHGSSALAILAAAAML